MGPGHLARRSSLAWGETARDAKRASDATFFFSNATLQHENFNNEWVSVINLSADAIDLEGWTLSDMKRKPLNLGKALKPDKRVLGPGEAVRVQPVEPLILSNRGGVITLYDKPTERMSKGRRIDRVRYTKEQASAEGAPIIFAYCQE